MLVLTRKVGQEILVGTPPDQIRVVVVEIRSGRQVKIGVDAPPHIVVQRPEAARAKTGQPDA